MNIPNKLKVVLYAPEITDIKILSDGRVCIKKTNKETSTLLNMFENNEECNVFVNEFLIEAKKILCNADEKVPLFVYFSDTLIENCTCKIVVIALNEFNPYVQIRKLPAHTLQNEKKEVSL